ncbi:MAG: ABC transporter substrate-binding protein [Methylococcales bacterium]|jgi:phospholipid transport system substrate-binding protein
MKVGKVFSGYKYILFLVLCCFVFSVKAGEAISAKDVVSTFQSRLIDAMNGGAALGFDGRYSQVEVAVRESHHLAKIARIVVGKEWVKLTKTQKRLLVERFSQLVFSSYAKFFSEYSGEAFSYVSEEETRRGGVIVHTLFEIPDDEDVKFDYMMKKKGDSWRIINIIANGVSDLALKRSEYTSVLSGKGFDALIAMMEQKINSFSKES